MDDSLRRKLAAWAERMGREAALETTVRAYAAERQITVEEAARWFGLREPVTTDPNDLNDWSWLPR